MKSAVVTGVSSGIGRACASRLANAGWRVIGLLRGKADADALSAELGAAFRPVIAALNDEASVTQAVADIAAAVDGTGLQALVNNAGTALLGPAILQDMPEIRAQMEVNFFAPLRLVQGLFPLLQKPGGRIVNVTSISGRLAAPFMGGYAASKFALEAISDALRVELAPLGINVIVIEPGPVATPLWAKTDKGDGHPYRGTPFDEAFSSFQRLFMKVGATRALPVAYAADVILKAVTDARPKSRYPIMRRPFFDLTLPSLLPDRARDSYWLRQINRR